MGATGGGYVLSRGVFSRVAVTVEGGGNEIVTSVNGDPAYNARTTRRALSLLFGREKVEFGRLELEQTVDVPIGCGFGASAASAISAVYAAASALGLKTSKSELAKCAYDAEIVERTGLGTVSVTYDGAGAGAITKPGIPGVSTFMNVKSPKGMRLVTASLGPYEKRDALSSAVTAQKIVELGDEALHRFVTTPTFEELAGVGEWFASNLGLETEELKGLVALAKSSGAAYASQNMIGRAIHAIADAERVAEVAEALRSASPEARIDVFEIGTVRAGLL